MKTQHTPGPWEFQPTSHTTIGTSGIFTKNHDIDKHVYICEVKMPYATDLEHSLKISIERVDEIIAERNANARLIASAPAMLEALEWLLLFAKNLPYPEQNQKIEEIKNLINQAKGL